MVASEMPDIGHHSRIENGRRQPTAAQLAVLAKIYGKPLESLLTVQIYSEIKTKYGQLEQFPDTVKIRGISSGERWGACPVGVPPLGGFGAQMGRINPELQRVNAR